MSTTYDDDDDELTNHIEAIMSYLAGREAQGANRHGVFIQLNFLNDEHLSSVVHSLLNVTVFCGGENNYH